jgi:tetrapyrrole methylase family protein / MazG family protein
VLELVEHLLGFCSLTAVGRNDTGTLVGGSARRLNSRSFFQLISNLDEAEPKLSEPVLDKPLLLNCEVALGLLLQHGENVNRMAGQREIGLWRLFIFLAQIEQTELELRLHQDGFNQEGETRWGDRNFVGRFSALGHKPSSYIFGRGQLMSGDFREAGEKFETLVQVTSRLRAPGGCPWDRKQTFDTIKSYLLEETYEVLDAIDARDWHGLAEELGDLLLQPVFLAEMATEMGLFTISDSLDAINEKLVRRHPHVFADAVAEAPEDVKLRWDEIKKHEKPAGASSGESVLNGVPRNLPALVEAEKIGQRAASTGFEWPDIGGVMEKLQEEAVELISAEKTGDQEHIEHELGDLLFTVVNLARFLKVDPEQALRKTNRRFRKRFGHVEEQIRVASSGVSLDQMEQFWEEAKRLEK